MKKFMILHVGFENPTPEIMAKWGKWFDSIKGFVADMGSPLGSGHDVSNGVATELGMDLSSLTGYTIINAESMDKAIEVAKTCPAITSVKVYELMSM